MDYPEPIWSQGWGSDAFLHLNNSTDLFGPLDFKFRNEFLTGAGVPYAAVSCNFIGHRRYCRNKSISDRTLRVLKSIDFPFNLVIMEGDFSWPYMDSSSLPKNGDLNWKGPKSFIDPIFYEVIELPNLQKIYCQNLNFYSLESYSHKLKHLPIGHCFHNYFDKTDLACSKMKELRLKNKKDDLLIPYHRPTNETRSKEIESLEGSSFCSYAPKSDIIPYLKNLACHKFVLSLHGAGADCHRHWEILSVGSIPVIKSSSLDPLFEGLPVIMYKNISEVNENFLMKKYREAKPLLVNREKLYRKFWINEFHK